MNVRENRIKILFARGEKGNEKQYQEKKRDKRHR